MNNKRGFTIVEMLLVIGIMSILVVILTQVFGSILTMKLRSQATTAVAQDSRYLLTRLAYDITRSSDLSVLSPQSLSLTINGVNYLYALSGTSLLLSVGGAPSQALTSIDTQITALNFTLTTVPPSLKKSVQISLTILPTIIQAGGARLERHLTTTLGLR